MLGEKAARTGASTKRHEAAGRQHRLCLEKARGHGRSTTPSVVFTTDNGAEAISFPNGGVTPFKGQKGEAWKAAIGRRWSSAGRATIKPGTVKTNCSRLSTGCRRLSTSGGPKGDDLKKGNRAGKYKASQDDARWLDQRDTSKQVAASGRDHFFYFSGIKRRRPCAKEIGDVLHHVAPGPAAGHAAHPVPLTLVQKSSVIRSSRMCIDVKSAMSGWRPRARPSTAFPIRWNIALAVSHCGEHLESYKSFRRCRRRRPGT